jgi:predicted membrane channel-forming protein YqfA (hemolysin III family)
MTTAAIDAHLLLKVLYTSLIAGVGVSVVFSVAVLGVVRSSEARRDERPTAAVSYALLGAAGLVLTAALIVYGLILLARKS